MQAAGSGLGSDLARLEDPAEQGHAVEEEAELARDVWRGEENCDAADDQPCAIAGLARSHPLTWCSATRPGTQRDGQPDADDRVRVRPLWVEMARRLDAGIGHG